MSNRNPGKSISDFSALSTIPADAVLTFISGGVNYKITKTDFLAALGVTGTLVADGASGATPVLDIAGSVNNIRSVEDGPGILSSVSAENGLKLEHNLTVDKTGSPIVISETLASPIVRSLVQGSGISLAASGNTITVSATSAPASNVVIVNAMTDFPAPVAGVITLAADTEYLVGGDLTTSNRFVLSNRSVLGAGDSTNNSITYTGTGTMFTGSNVTAKIKDITVEAATGTLLNVTGSGAEIFQMLGVTVTSCGTVGTIGSLLGFQIDQCIFSDIKTNGITFTGAMGTALIQSALNNVNGGTFFNLGSATFNALSFISNFTTLASGTFFLSGLASSGNINSGSLGAVTNSRFSGAGTPLSTVTANDARWQFAENDGIADTRVDGLLSLTTTDTITITTINVAVKIDGPWNSERASQMTAATTGTITYNGEKGAIVPITANVSMEPVSGTNKNLSLYIAINGTKVANSRARTTISAGSPKNTPVLWQVALAAGDTVEVHVENNSDTTNVQINSAILRVN